MKTTVSAADIAVTLNKSLSTIQKWAKNGQLPGFVMTTTGGCDRPQMRWAIPDLPASVTIRGEVIVVRDVIRKREEKAIFKAVFQEQKKLDAAPAAPMPVVSKGGSKAVALVPRADGTVVIRGQTRKAHKEGDLTDKDKARRDGALVLCVAIDAVMVRIEHRIRRKCSAKLAITELAGLIIGGTAFPELIDAAAVTYVKPRKTGQTVEALVSRLQKMHKAYKEGLKTGDAGCFLVPNKCEQQGFDPIHIRAFLIHFCRPSRPPVTEAWRDSEAWFIDQSYPRPAVDTFYRIENFLPVTVKYRGRMTGSQWKSLLPYVARDVSMFSSNDIWVGDGHSFKAKVQHPIHGQPFTPEVTLLIDWVSRKIVGWSIDLAESTIAVSAAFRHAQIETRARPLVYYSDNGGGQTGKLIDCPIHGTLARQGVAHETGIPGSPQGRGIIERIWQVTLIPLARTYPTCTWKGADKETTRKMLVALNKKDGSGEKLLPTWAQFIADIEQCVKKYNTTHEHSELGGNTPEATYQARLDPDSICYGPSDAEIDQQWMPEVSRTPQRGVVSLFGNEYANKVMVEQLAEGEKVRVRFDIHNADQVWLLRMDGRFLCVAEWDAHKRAAFPVPFIEQKREERVAGKIKLAEKKIALANAELGNVIEGESVPVKTIVDFLDVTPQAAPERELTAADFIQAKTEEKESSYSDTVMWLYGDKQEESKGDVAAR